MASASDTHVSVGSSVNHRAYRVDAIDMLRGLVIVIMAIDHVRDNFLGGTVQDPTEEPNIASALFFTRWITHFCAPVFVLLAGVSAGLMTNRRNPSQLGRFLLTRGLWLIFVEVFIVSSLVTCSPGGVPQLGGRVLLIMQVIWAIGASMMVLAGLQWLGRLPCLAFGTVIMAAHNLLDLVWPASHMMDLQWPIWVALHSQMSAAVGPFLFLFAYPVLPWIGVMALGFGLSPVFERSAEERNTILLRGGTTMTAAFVILRAAGFYGDPNPWQQQPAGAVATVIDFLNTTKYPPSLLFLLMTLGPSAISCVIADRTSGGIFGRIKGALLMFGRVPFAFYVAHFALIHVFSVALGVMQGFELRQMMTIFIFYPQGYGLNLMGMYVVWAMVVAILYPFCRWVSGVKTRRRDWWLSYV